MIKSPLRWCGGKSRAVKTIAPLVPTGIKEYREPMVGGGSVFFYLKQTRPFVQRWWINDAYYPLIEFWESMKLADQVQSSVEFFKQIKNEMTLEQLNEYFFSDKKGNTYPVTGSTFFIRNRCSFSGTTEAGGFSKQAATNRFTMSSIERLRPLPGILADTKISWGDFSPVIQEPGEDVFIYLDPPYVTAKRLYGKNGALHAFDHDRLAKNLTDTPHKWLLSYDDCPQVRELYKDFTIETFELQYGMSSGGSKKPVKKGAELLIRNY